MHRNGRQQGRQKYHTRRIKDEYSRHLRFVHSASPARRVLPWGTYEYDHNSLLVPNICRHPDNRRIHSTWFQEKAKVVPRDLLSNMDRKTCSKRYGYLASLCVARAARRRGIATNMLLFALTTAKLRGADQVYAHVHRDNLRAQQLYEKHGFEIVAHASERLLKENTYLLCCNLLYKRKFSVIS